jgi:2-oxoacid:acceptor oxidoreductase delta subunit (pyruvate/2-ketoisovalerate family)
MRPRPACPLPVSEPEAPCKTPRRDEPPALLTLEAARSEAARCLSLNECRGCEVCQLMCPDQAIRKDPVTHQPIIDLAYCKGCGLCAHLCPKGAIIMILEQKPD